MERIKNIYSILLVVLLSSQCLSQIRLPSIISDNMVLQEGSMDNIWGWADANEQVTVTISGQKNTAVADVNGNWMVKLNPLKAGGPIEMTVAGQENSITVKNILVGEVWIGSGQSNMEWRVSNCNNAQREISEANYPSIRLFTVPRTKANQPASDCNGQWKLCSPANTESFSAAAYFFGRDLHKSIQRPVGLINSSWGGTPAEAWTPLETFRADPCLIEIPDRWDRNIKSFPKQLEIYRAKTKKWQENVKLAKQSEKNIDVQKPRPPYYNPNSHGRPGALYMGMISPLLNYTIKGVIWYQGESNASNGRLYKRLFPAMITGWRKAWNQGDFPFFFVQLANFDVSAYASRDWALLREAQTDTLSLPNTAMVVTIDIGEANNIHPKNKQELGRRLALAALAKSYGKDIEYSGPMYKSFNVEDNKVIITLNHSKGLKINGSVAKGFQIASEDMNFVDADAVVTSDDKIKIWNDSIEKPVAVRYGWSNNPENCNLYNSVGLPASPFRTDSWPSIIEEKIKTGTKTINAAN